MPWIRTLLIAALLVVPAATGADKSDDAPQDEAAAQAERERRFSEQLSHVVMNGHFTVVGQDLSDLKTEKYEIESVKKLKGDYWTFTVGIKYGQTDVKLPLTLKVLWAGDTPMVTLTDFAIPLVGSGKFSARVLFYKDRYAGTWQHDNVGGHLFGTIEKQQPAAGESK